MLDVSQQPELIVFAPIVGELEDAARKVGVEIMLTGAFARDLHAYANGLVTGRRTENVDFAVAVRNWDDFDALKSHLKLVAWGERRQFGR